MSLPPLPPPSHAHTLSAELAALSEALSVATATLELDELNHDEDAWIAALAACLALLDAIAGIQSQINRLIALTAAHRLAVTLEEEGHDGPTH